ncbi:hypothetical protein MX659_09010 [Coriobacteriia bacterium Es71-Z0120]|jgi:hypothetical protein|uniref:hypothetical protein n=1 Tax=Parvivirga hydrogeniphila TaxID=2939460 RepID=UPI001997444B|nr:hypothetical protein [Parvivirga hydrogeniphila]MBC7267080.1 hypothetical protein [Coriobacteriia bacterium]MCL4079722.1 hypothetical protein [Parvivirga hydrogeniphila]
MASSFAVPEFVFVGLLAAIILGPIVLSFLGILWLIERCGKRRAKTSDNDQ